MPKIVKRKDYPMITQPIVTKKRIKWAAVAVVVGWGAAFGLSAAFQCAPCTAILTMQKPNLPSIYEEEPVSSTIVWETPRVE